MAMLSNNMAMLSNKCNNQYIKYQVTNQLKVGPKLIILIWFVYIKVSVLCDQYKYVCLQNMC